MTAQQLAEVLFPVDAWNPWKSAFAVWNRADGSIRERRNAARYQRAIAELPPHLRHDMGEIDCCPMQPEPLSETLRSRGQTLETTWQRPLR